MIKSKFKRVTSLFLATLMCVTTFAGIGSTTAYAASGEKADVYMVDFPRDGDANYDGVWGHSNLTLKNGWHTGRSNFTNLKAIGSYSGNVAYCIEPGISLKVGQTMNKYDENYFNNLAANGVISGDEIRLFVGRILQYGYRGTISTSWRSQNEAAANSIAQAYATQLLIWETVIGERDANFNHVAASGCSNVKDVINKAGVGFINEAMRGTLKIVKTSSDGKVKGFAFRVTGANGYDMTFETDKNGEIVIEGLRIGEYTVSEVANNASAAYITPADQNVTIKLDETAVVKMHNELRDTPKTGDDTNMKLWYVLAGLSAVGIAVTSVVAHKKKKKEGNE
ncbi:MAG: SpaA isopeptide-forming pilin-related protein [Clostridiales bacterium]|nr:SpaA isopeptide-forming pilin-related protein [Clostridiales bacterium]MDY4114105.1 SpaA isopeptide-forming pilin-related protein [Roseburia sp.]MDY6131987.1 SpaA isopeptide-forming pilin-related protein [Candidatus Limivicinus sp.]